MTNYQKTRPNRIAPQGVPNKAETVPKCRIYLICRNNEVRGEDARGLIPTFFSLLIKI